METARIAELLEPYIGADLSQQQFELISTYVDTLLKWNARLNLTAVRDPEEMVRRHFGESFFAARYLLTDATAAITAMDVGSGAGFPGIPLKLYAPHLSLRLVEAQNKKAVFLREVTRALQLTGVTVIGARAESVTTTAELVTMRAVEKFEAVLPIAARLVQPGGRLGLLVGERQVEAAREILGGEWAVSGTVPNSAGRVVAVWEKRPE